MAARPPLESHPVVDRVGHGFEVAAGAAHGIARGKCQAGGDRKQRNETTSHYSLQAESSGSVTTRRPRAARQAHSAPFIGRCNRLPPCAQDVLCCRSKWKRIRTSATLEN